MKAALDAVISEKVKQKLDSALKTPTEAHEASEATVNESSDSSDGIQTTQDEIEAYNILRAIASEVIPIDDIARRDAKSYCAILYQDNNRKPVCRLYFNNPQRLAVGFFDAEAEEKILIEKISDIYNFRDKILTSIKKYSKIEE